jgi:serpin B
MVVGAASANTFAFDLYGRLRSSKGNVVFSPFSMASALAMMWMGAEGETEAQMKRVLHFEGSGLQSAAALGELSKAYAMASDGMTWRVANRIFVENRYPLEKEYVEHSGATFGATPESLDFRHSPEESRVTINDWVAEKTERRILDLIPEKSIKAETRLVVANAVNFFGNWAHPFSPEMTRPAPFFVAKGSSKNVPMMHQQLTAKFASVDDMTAVEITYAGSKFAMLFVLPDAVDGLPSVEAHLTTEGYLKLLRSASSGPVVISLPRFELTWGTRFAWSTALAGLGMPDAFDDEKANFHRIAKPLPGESGLYIGNIFHKAFVKVDESGTKATAATAVESDVVRKSFAAPPPVPVFNADHPFLFFLRDVESTAVLFIGRVTDPAATGT